MAATPKHRTPRSMEAARKMLERYAALEDQIAWTEGLRNSAIAAANAASDREAEPLIAERDEIRTKLEPWWSENATEVTGGKRKSAELGGCLIGTVAGRDSLDVAGDEAQVVTALGKRDWAKPLLRVKTSLDRSAILKSIDGVYKKQLAALGLKRKCGEVTFFIKRAEQGGTQAEIKP